MSPLQVTAYLCLLGVVAANKPLLRDYEVVEVMQHPSWRLLSPDHCGYSNQGRIIGGHEPDLGAFPWIARLGYIDLTREGVPHPSFKCGGSLINDRYVITAAHCIVENTKPGVLKVVRLGEHNAKSNPDCAEGVCAPPVQDFDIEEVFSYTGYGVPKSKHDIGLIRLQHRPQMNEYVRPICIQFSHFMFKDYTGWNATVAGWGVTSMDVYRMTSILQTVDVPILPMERCLEEGGEERNLDELQICAGGNIGKDSCGGDSGGPLMLTDAVNSGPVFFLYGLVSYGPHQCGATTTPGVYTRISGYMPWILDHMRP